MADYIMAGRTLAARAVDIAQRKKTIYMYAAYGFKVTDATIKSKSLQNLNGWYTTKRINMLKEVANQQPSTWGFDCVNLIKGILWGWTGDETKEKGGAVYGSNGIPDTNADGMIKRCSGVSSDFTDIAVGEAVWISGHIGIYIGDGLAVECTPSWANGVQITAVHNIGKQAGFNGRTWTKHGKLPHVDYGTSDADARLTPAPAGAPSPEGKAGEEETPEYALGARLLKKGCQGEDVRELQRLLIQLGYELGDWGPKHDGSDGEFGTATLKALLAFQAAAALEVDGLFGPASLAALKAALEAQSEAPEPRPALYTLTLRHVSAETAEKMRELWPEIEIAEEGA